MIAPLAYMCIEIANKDRDSLYTEVEDTVNEMIDKRLKALKGWLSGEDYAMLACVLKTEGEKIKAQFKFQIDNLDEIERRETQPNYTAVK